MDDAHSQSPSRLRALVQFKNVSKSYDGRSLVVDGLDLEVASGEFLTLLGPSGSGKTTTLMMLAGFETPTGGRILLGGRDITDMPPHRRGIGVVFQNYALFPHMTVNANVGYPLAVRGMGTDELERRVAAALDMVKLSGFGDRRPAQLSGGQQQRVALARALVFEPELVLLDEPLGALDKQLRERMQAELKQIHETLGVTMVYVTHDQSEALTMSDRIAVFNDGKVQQLSAPATLYEQPANAFVAGFVGENNQVSGTVVAVGTSGVRMVVAGGHEIVGRSVGELAPGQRVLVTVRPEHVVLARTPIGNSLPATVSRLVYLGDSVRVVLSLAPDYELVAKVARRDLAPEIVRGKPVTAGFAPEDCLAFPLSAQ